MPRHNRRNDGNYKLSTKNRKDDAIYKIDPNIKSKQVKAKNYNARKYKDKQWDEAGDES